MSSMFSLLLASTSFSKCTSGIDGSMRDKWNFIVGCHEILHYMFMLTGIGLDLSADNENIRKLLNSSSVASIQVFSATSGMMTHSPGETN